MTEVVCSHFAFSIVDIENDDNWLWFLSSICGVLEAHTPTIIDEENVLTFLSDQKGLLDTINVVFPYSEHGYWLKHLEVNFYKVYKYPEFKSLL